MAFDTYQYRVPTSESLNFTGALSALASGLRSNACSRYASHTAASDHRESEAEFVAPTGLIRATLRIPHVDTLAALTFSFPTIANVPIAKGHKAVSSIRLEPA